MNRPLSIAQVDAIEALCGEWHVVVFETELAADFSVTVACTNYCPRCGGDGFNYVWTAAGGDFPIPCVVCLGGGGGPHAESRYVVTWEGEVIEERLLQ